MDQTYAPPPRTTVPPQNTGIAPAEKDDASAAAASLAEGHGVGTGDALALQDGFGNASVQELLTDQGWFDRVSPTEASQALDSLLALPPEARGAAVDALDAEALENLLYGLPEERQAELLALASASVDAQRKLDIWSVAHRAQAEAALAGQEEDSPWFFDSSPEAMRARHREEIREATLVDTEAEIEDEVLHVEGRVAAGETIAPEEIDAMMARKTMELDIEAQYGVNLTNRRGATGLLAMLRDDELREFGRRVWSADELVEVEGALSRLPEAHVRDNLALQEIRRMEAPTHGLQMLHGDLGSTRDGRVSIYDEAAVGLAPTSVPVDEFDCPPVNLLRTERTSALAHHAPGQSGPDGELSRMQDTVTHEIGHTVAEARPEEMLALEEAAGWRRLDDLDAVAAWLTEVNGVPPDAQALNVLERGRTVPGALQNPTRSGDWTYGYDTYDPDGYVIHASGAIPEDQEFAAMNSEAQRTDLEDECSMGTDNWAYARSGPEEHFAELYTKAVHQPEALRVDLLDEPAANVALMEERIAEAQYWLDYCKANGGSQEEIAGRQADLLSTEGDLQRVREDQASLAAQWEMLHRLLPDLPP